MGLYDMKPIIIVTWDHAHQLIYFEERLIYSGKPLIDFSILQTFGNSIKWYDGEWYEQACPDSRVICYELPSIATNPPKQLEV